MDSEGRKSEITLKIDKATAFSLILLVVGMIIGFFLSFSFRITGLAVLSPEDAGKRAINYINENLVAPGETATLVDVEEMGDLYKVITKYKGREIPVYITRDGRYLLLNAFDTSQKLNPTLTCEDVPKKDKPLLRVFVVSKCPFGLQMQRILVEIVKNIPTLADNIEVLYIGSVRDNKIISMHGDEEAQENLRQICIREEQSGKYWEYIACYIKEGNTTDCLVKANIDINKLHACMNNTSRGLKYAKDDFDLYDEYKLKFAQKVGTEKDRISIASPAVIINDDASLTYDKAHGTWDVSTEFAFAHGEGTKADPRSAENLKELLCCGFVKKPNECSIKLADTRAATWFSETYSKSSESSTSGRC